MEILGKISILRKVINVDGSIDLIEHHGFSDAILPNYGASVYEIVFEKKKDITVNLIASKSRFASMKKTTIPAWKSFIE